jgi:DnaK suppressor protein
MKRIDLGERLRPLLLARRASLLHSLSSELSLLSHDDDEPHEEEIFSRLSLSESRELDAINGSLQRMRDGSYGVCEGCGRNISLARLQALPYISTCIDCQRLCECGSPRGTGQLASA